MHDGTALGDSLRTRRGGLTPADVGITSYGARRVPGQSHQASPSVIEAPADALRLSDADRACLRTLLRPQPAGAPGRPAHTALQLLRLTASADH